jgi:hypothetical protein
MYKIWDSTDAVLVENSTDSGVTWNTVNASLYTIDYLQGTVIFGSANLSSVEVRATGYYVPISLVANAYEWDLSIDANLISTTLLGATWKSQVSGLKSGTVKFSQYWQDNFYFTNLGTRYLIVMLVDNANYKGYIAYGWQKNDSVNVVNDDVIKEDVNFDVDNSIEALY